MPEIALSEVQIIPIKPHNGLLAFCSFIINNSFYVGNVAIYSRLDGSGYRLVYPNKVISNGAKINCFYPINNKSAQAIEEQVVEAFLNLIEKAKTKKGAFGNDRPDELGKRW